jgi:sugar phosphate permease
VPSSGIGGHEEPKIGLKLAVSSAPGQVSHSPYRRWVVLAVGLVGLIAGCAAQYGLAFLIPALREEGMSLEQATLLVIAPVFGIMCTLIAWGAAADRWGERRILTLGLAITGVAELGAGAASDDLARWVLLFVTGAASASIHAASGRLILGWFAVHERGLAMGIRQTGQPLGVAAAALVLPPVAAAAGVDAAFAVLGVACLVSATLIWIVVRDPVRPHPATVEQPGTPYREPYLWRIHAASGLLVIPQFAVAVFAFDYLTHALGWSITDAGLLLAVTQLAGAGSRVLAGWWSDRAGSRLGPMRIVAVTIGATLLLLSVLAYLGAGLAVIALAAASALTTMPNGLAFTAVAERAGARWAGRALGVQNTFQNVIATVVPTPLALLIGAAGGGAVGYALAFGSVVAFPLIAAVVIPVGSELRSHAPGASVVEVSLDER